MTFTEKVSVITKQCCEIPEACVAARADQGLSRDVHEGELGNGRTWMSRQQLVVRMTLFAVDDEGPQHLIQVERRHMQDNADHE